MAALTLPYCAQQVRQYDPDRFLCAQFAPPAEREALIALCAFSLELALIREHVREPLLGHMRLRWWSDALDAIAAGQPPQHPVADALAAAMRSFVIDRQLLKRMIEGRAIDFDEAQPASLDRLLDYAEATSASLSLAALQVLAPDDATVREGGRDVAIAWALVGLVRSVPFHVRSRRLYLPSDLCRDSNVDPARLFDRGVTDGVPIVARRLAEEAVERLKRARLHRRAVPARALPMLLPAALADHYLRRLDAVGYDPFDPALQRREAWRLPRLAWARLTGRF